MKPYYLLPKSEPHDALMALLKSDAYDTSSLNIFP
jgi:hypothetical protein